MRWPWQRARRTIPRPRSAVWPKKAYFLDGPMAGKTAVVNPGLFITIPVNTNEGIIYWRYRWETIYARGEVAYVRFMVPA